MRNRGSQYGPIGGMGQRTNAAEPRSQPRQHEARDGRGAVAGPLLTAYDPHIAIDLHTTDGTRSRLLPHLRNVGESEHSPGITSLLRDDLLPAVTKAVKAKHGWSYFYYGGLTRGSGERAWARTLDLDKPRYTSTYFGVRNRLGILSETYSYASFEDRIKADYWFLEEIINYAVKNGEAIRKATAAADAESIIGTPQAVRGRLVKAPDPVEVVLADVVDERNPYRARPPHAPARRRQRARRNDAATSAWSKAPRRASRRGRASSRRRPWPRRPPRRRPAAGGAAGGRAGPAAGAPGPGGRGGMGGQFGRPMGNPTARVIASVVDRLEAHGVRYFKTPKETTFKGERFRIASSEVAQAEYQGTHKLRTITGAWETTEQAIPAGSLVVPMDQPLARLAFILFDPRSDDGLMAWNILDPMLGATPAPEFYPVLRTMETVAK